MTDLLSYKDIFKALPGAYVILKNDGCFTVAAATNSALEKIGVLRDDFIGYSLFKLLPEDNLKQELEDLANCIDPQDCVIETPHFSILNIAFVDPVGTIRYIIQRWARKF